MLSIKLIVITLLASIVAGTELEVVSDDDLVHTIKRNSFAVVLFSKKNCDKCDEIETKLSNMVEDLRQQLDAVTVKAFNSQLVRLYSPSKEPALVFFRHGIPILYDGAVDEDSISQYFFEFRDPTVRELTDETFEHLTQATSGSTTGDWFIQFYTNDCIDCQRLGAIWESVGAALKNRGNVARVNLATTGPKTANRFKVKKVPEFVFIRQGKYYKYDFKIYDAKAFIQFATQGYVNASPHPIPVPESPFDGFVEMGVKALTFAVHNGRMLVAKYPYPAIGVASVLGCIIIALLLRGSGAKKSKTKKTEKKSSKATTKSTESKKKKAT